MTTPTNPATHGAGRPRTPRTHVLAGARVRSLAARPAGPFRVVSAHALWTPWR